MRQAGRLHVYLGVLFTTVLVGILFLVQPGSVSATIAATPEHLTDINSRFTIPSNAKSSITTDGVATLTQDMTSVTGTIWSNAANKMDLTKPFTATMSLNFGDKGSKAADGMAFVMQGGDSTVYKPGANAEQLGVWGSSARGVGVNNESVDSVAKSAIQNSFAVEFDTHSSYVNDANYWDTHTITPMPGRDGTSYSQAYKDSATQITSNHVAYNFPGLASSYANVRIGYNNSFISANYYRELVHQGLQEVSNLADGNWHDLTVTWTPGTGGPGFAGTLTYTFDGVTHTLRIIPNNVFGSSSVTWGFTGQNGSQSEKNQVVFKSIIVGNPADAALKTDATAYHLDGTEVTKTNPASPGDRIQFKVNATAGTDTVANLNGRLSKDGGVLTAVSDEDLKSFSVNGVSGSAADLENFTGLDGSGDEAVGLDFGALASGNSKKIMFTTTAVAASQIDTTGLLSSDYVFSFKNKTAADSTAVTSTAKVYVTSLPTLKLTKPLLHTTEDTPYETAKDAPLNFVGFWNQTPIASASAVGTLHYKFTDDDGYDSGDREILTTKTSDTLNLELDTTGLEKGKVYHGTAYMTNAGYNQKSNEVNFYFKLKGGTVAFSKVNDNLSFKQTTLGQTVLTQRASEDWAPTVLDTRGMGSKWSVSVASKGMQIPDTATINPGKKLNGGLVYVNNGVTTDIKDDDATTVSSYTTASDDDEHQITWAANQGILLKVNAGAYQGDYQGELDWTLNTVPDP